MFSLYFRLETLLFCMQSSGEMTPRNYARHKTPHHRTPSYTTLHSIFNDFSLVICSLVLSCPADLIPLHRQLTAGSPLSIFGEVYIHCSKAFSRFPPNDTAADILFSARPFSRSHSRRNLYTYGLWLPQDNSNSNFFSSSRSACFV